MINTCRYLQPDWSSLMARAVLWSGLLIANTYATGPVIFGPIFTTRIYEKGDS